jgi:hypothetical protein
VGGLTPVIFHMRQIPPLRYFAYVLPTIWLILAGVILLCSLAFTPPFGLPVIAPLYVVGTVAGIVAVYKQL